MGEDQEAAKQVPLYAWVGHRNFGDELSPYLINAITRGGARVVNRYKANKLVAIGSLLADYSLLTNSHIWGSGFLSEYEGFDISPFKLFPLSYAYGRYQMCYHTKPSHLYALRGPLSAQRLKDSNISFPRGVPEVYGDPAILLPYVYSPTSISQTQRTKLYRLGIAFHQQQEALVSQFKQDLQQTYGDEILLISMIRNGSKAELEQCVDEICSCDLIASTSLHGIIVAQAYGIPAAMLQYTAQPLQKHSTFKFDDFFLGTGQKPSKPVGFSDVVELVKTLDSDASLFFTPPSFRDHCERLLEVFPFQERLKLRSLPR